jgi:hypothetical protein
VRSPESFHPERDAAFCDGRNLALKRMALRRTLELNLTPRRNPTTTGPFKLSIIMAILQRISEMLRLSRWWWGQPRGHFVFYVDI